MAAISGFVGLQAWRPGKSLRGDACILAELRPGATVWGEDLGGITLPANGCGSRKRPPSASDPDGNVLELWNSGSLEGSSCLRDSGPGQPAPKCWGSQIFVDKVR